VTPPGESVKRGGSSVAKEGRRGNSGKQKGEPENRTALFV
jgi:hypothetical protein